MVNITSDNKWKKLIIVGDRVLIKLSKPDERTSSGLYLPPGVQEKRKFNRVISSKQAPASPFP